jgi:hypothetical protein
VPNLKGIVTGISLLHEFELKTMNERFLCNTWKQAENKNKTGKQEFHHHGTRNEHTGI